MFGGGVGSIFDVLFHTVGNLLHYPLDELSSEGDQLLTDGDMENESEGAELLADGSMEYGLGAELLANNASMLVADWAAGNNAALGNQISNDTLRIARDGTDNPYAAQSVMTIGNRYRVKG